MLDTLCGSGGCLGGVDRNTGRGFLELVPDRTAATLLPIILQNIAPGTIIHCDGWQAYASIQNLPVNPPYQHLVVIHDRNFVDPVTGACKNRVECFWKNCKLRFKQMAGVHRGTLDSHLDEVLRRKIHGDNEEALNNLLRHLCPNGRQLRREAESSAIDCKFCRSTPALPRCGILGTAGDTQTEEFISDWKDVSVNVGGDLDPQSGSFTAPRQSLYAVTCYVEQRLSEFTGELKVWVWV